MTDENRGQDLPQRVRGATRTGTGPSASPALSAELLQRIQAAVKAERGEAAAKDAEATMESPTGVPSSRPDDGRVIQPAANGVNAPAPIKQEPRSERPEAPQAASPQASTAKGSTAKGSAPQTRAPRTNAPGKPSPSPRRRRRSGRGRLVALALAVIVTASAAVLVAKHLVPSRGNSATTHAAVLRAEMKARDQAVAWMVQQVSRNAQVSCDQAMCRALRKDGFPASKLIVLGPTSPDPVSSDIVVLTAAVRSMFGTSLGTAYAPAVLASFGSGAAEISIRVIAPHGILAFQTALNADLADRKAAEGALQNNPRIKLSPTAGQQLAAGQVDSRLILAIASLAGSQPIYVVRFGNIGSGGSPDMPLRFADLASDDQAAHMSRSAYVRSVLAYLSTISRYRPARTVPMADQGQPVLRVEFTAPSPFGLFSSKTP